MGSFRIFIVILVASLSTICLLIDAQQSVGGIIDSLQDSVLLDLIIYIVNAILSAFGITTRLTNLDKVYDCTNIPYTATSAACNRHRAEMTPAEFSNNYPCCVCDPTVGVPPCNGGEGCYVIRNTQVDSNITSVGTALFICNKTDFEPMSQDCQVNADCNTDCYCIKKCYEFKKKYGSSKKAIEVINIETMCCSCGSPLTGDCDSCNCYKGNFFLKFKLFSRGILVKAKT